MKIAVMAALAAVSIWPATALAQESATARMINRESAEVGSVTFTQSQSGYLHIFVEATGLPPGPHGIHIHETGQCDPTTAFESAGGHYAGGKEHGFMAENGPHAGDLPNVHVGQDGLLKVEFFTERLSLAEGAANPLRDADGSAIVIHAGPDDYASDPSGNSGDRLACGVIE
jgi:superoxide dismutase, Cu-Zn family